MTTTTQQAALARREPSAAAIANEYSNDFAQVMPSHVRSDAWLRIATGALKRGKKAQAPNGQQMYELEIAAINNPAAFLSSLLEAARLGLEPGTEQYYLTPRKVKGQLEILGIVGYQGYVELMYRAGYVSSVIVENVYTKDEFDFQPGQHEIPQHRINWDLEDRGELRLSYAYARMKGGGYSKVVVCGPADIARAKAMSQGSDSQYSPWQTNKPAMWLKTAVRALRKWVPTSAEIMGLPRPDAKQLEPAAPLASAAVGASVNYGGELADEVAEAEFIEDDEDMPPADTGTGEVLGEWPPVAPAGGGA